MSTLKEDLARMAAEDKAATPGPWEYSYGWVDRPYDGGSAPIAKLSDYEEDAVDGTANGTAIASARTDRPALEELVKLLISSLMPVLMGNRLDDDARSMAERELDLLWAEAQKKATSR